MFAALYSLVSLKLFGIVLIAGAYRARGRPLSSATLTKGSIITVTINWHRLCNTLRQPPKTEAEKAKWSAINRPNN